MLLHLAMMLSKASGWGLPSDGKAHDSPLSSHELAITGEVDGAGDRRRLASGCNSNWSVCPPPPTFSPSPNRAAAFLLAAYKRVRLLTVFSSSVTAATPAATIAAISVPLTATPHVTIRATVVHETSATGCRPLSGC